MTAHANLHSVRARNGKFVKKPVAAAAPPTPALPPRRKHTNGFVRLPDSELLKLCPRKYLDLATMLFAHPHRYGYKGHRSLFCTYLQAIENLRRLEAKMGEVFIRRSRFYGSFAAMTKIRKLKLMDLYHLCTFNGIQVPFGTERWQMLEWLETRCEQGTLLLEPLSEPTDDFLPQDALGDQDGGENTPTGRLVPQRGI
jgi:hypothetical protein